MADRPAASLPGLGDQRPGDGRLADNRSVGERRDSLSDRLQGGRPDQLPANDRQQARQDRQDNRGDRQENRGDRRDDRGQARDDRQQNRGDRQDNRGDRQQDRQENRGDRQQNREEMRQDFQQTRDDWYNRRDEIREDWQDYRDDARNDWEGWFDDHYGMYDDWYSGYAPGYWGQWDSLWDEYPIAAVAGLTWWGANSLGYQFGYSDYTNPYYTEEMPAYYSEPIITVPIESAQTVVVAPAEAAAPAAPAAPVATGLPPGATPEGVSKFDEARAAFMAGQYDAALKLTDAAVAQMPRDAVLHEFRSLVLFALQRYREAAATIHPVLDVGPGWDWKTLSSLYPGVDVYTTQLRVLEAARTKDPKAADLRFLLGYHYLTCGHADQALAEFRRALEVRPNDSVTTGLVATLAPRDAQPAQAAPGKAPPTVPPDKLVGNWKATGKGKSSYSMSLNKDGSFTWGFTQGARKQEVKGVHTVEGNVLAMEPDSGGVLVAELTPKSDDAIQFKMIGGQKGDPGLEFRREPAKQGE
jgi:tetratricopeptide (TPR) repeat protein